MGVESTAMSSLETATKEPEEGLNPDQKTRRCLLRQNFLVNGGLKIAKHFTALRAGGSLTFRSTLLVA